MENSPTPSNHWVEISAIFHRQPAPLVPYRPVKISIQTLEVAKHCREEWATKLKGILPPHWKSYSRGKIRQTWVSLLEQSSAWSREAKRSTSKLQKRYPGCGMLVHPARDSDVYTRDTASQSWRLIAASITTMPSSPSHTGTSKKPPSRIPRKGCA